MLSGVLLRMRSSLPLVLPYFMQRALVRVARCASMELCTSRPISLQKKLYRSAGSRWEIQPKCYRRASMTVSGFERDEATTGKITHRLSEVLRSHASDEVQMHRPS